MSAALEKPSALSRAYAFVLHQLEGQHYPPGSMISAADIAKELGISRTPTREAFQMLAAEGWLRIYPRRGALVLPVSIGDIRNLFEFRQVRETWSLEKILQRPITKEFAAGLRSALTEAGEDIAKDAIRFRKSARKVHELILQESGNTLMPEAGKWLFRQQLSIGFRILQFDLSMEHRRELLESHKYLVDAILDRNLESARTILHNLMHRSTIQMRAAVQ